MINNTRFELYEYDSVSGVKKRAKKMKTIINFFKKKYHQPREGLFRVKYIIDEQVKFDLSIEECIQEQNRVDNFR